jgi:hypothetical protein
MSDLERPSASSPGRRILLGTTLVLVLGVLAALAVYGFAHRSTGTVLVVSPHLVSDNQPPSEFPSDRHLRPIPVEVPISDIEETILKQRPTGFVIRAKWEWNQPGHTRGAYFKYWDGSNWADYPAVAEIFPSNDLAETRMKSCNVPQDADSLEVVTTAEVK